MVEPIIRVLNRIIITENGCWEWTGSQDSHGYGHFRNGSIVKVHRFIYEYYYGAICPDLTIDHLCRNRKCCNPLHLEQVSNQENVLRGIGVTAVNARKTHCKYGHEFSKFSRPRSDGGRRCLICQHNDNLRHGADTL